MDAKAKGEVFSAQGKALAHITLSADGSASVSVDRLSGRVNVIMPGRSPADVLAEAIRPPPPPPARPKTLTGTYTKLKSGAWGVRVNGSASAGGSVLVTKRDGQTKTEIVEKVLWTDGQVSLCAIRQSAPGGGTGGVRPTSSGGGGHCDECGRTASKLIPCRDSSGISGRCCPRCAAMSSYERSFA